MELLERIHQHRIWHRVALRITALIALAFISLIFEEVGENRKLMALLLVATIPIVALLPKVLPASKWMLGQSCFDVTATVCLIWLVPSVWTAGLVIVVASPAASAAIIGQRAYVAIELFGLAGLGAAASLTGVDGWQVPLLVAFTLALLVRSYVDVFLAHDQSASAELDAMTRSNPVIFWEVDVESGRVLSVSGRVQSILGYHPSMFPKQLSDLIHPDDLHMASKPDASLDGAEFVQVRAQHCDGEWVWLRLHVRLVITRGKSSLRSVAVDITELVVMHEETRSRAETDELTGLMNRAALLHRLRKMLASDEPVALFVLDLDRFKEVNDTLGHHNGDLYLCAVGELLSKALEDRGHVARLGGDEFAVITTALSRDAMDSVGDDLMQALSDPVTIEGMQLGVSGSFGLAWSPDHGTTPADLLRRADLAMYAAKQTAEPLHKFDFDSDEANIERLTLSAQLGPAIAEGEMQLWFQPLIDLNTGSIAALEGLVRWHHPTKGVLAPASFLDLVEISRHFGALSASVTHQAIDVISELERGGHDIDVSVNISVRDLLDAGYLETLASTLETSGIDATRLTLELVEREVADDRDEIADACRAVRDLGPRLAVDDFGTGQSSLLRLHQLPVDELKIDRSFILALDRDETDSDMIVRSIISLGHNLGLKVVAEGVESQRMAEILRLMGCDLAQGYLYTPALPISDIIEMLEQSRSRRLGPGSGGNTAIAS